MERYIEEQREAFGVPGCAVGIVDGDEVTLARGFGTRNGTDPVTPETLFAIGSVTKSFTAATGAALVQDKDIEWDRPVREYLPHFQLHDPVATERLSVRDMLSHRSGLPRHDFIWYGLESMVGEEIVKRLRYLEPTKDFRTAWQYNNLLYMTAGYMFGLIRKTTWEDLVSTRLLDPLGMKRTNFHVDDSAADADHALGFQEIDDELRQIPFYRGSGGPAGAINSSIADMAAWLRANLGRVPDVLSPEVVRALHAPTMVMPEIKLWPESTDHAYGLGWFVGNYRGHKVVHHGGNIDGFSAFAAILPDRGAGVVCLTNMNATSLPAVVVYRAFDELLGLEPLDWGARYLGHRNAAKTAMRAAEAIDEPVAGTSLSHPIEDYAGTYEHPAYGAISFSVSDGKLVPSIRGLEIGFEHRHYDVFELRILRFEGARFPVRFRTDFHGAVDAIEMPLESALAPIVFAKRPPEADVSVLEACTGRFAFGAAEFTVTIEGGKLVVNGPGQRMELQPAGGLHFRVPEVPMLRIEFVLGEDGTADRMVVQPQGVLERVR